MTILSRVLSLSLPRRQSAFLWGARKTGKSTYLKQRFPESVVFDLLDTDLVLSLSKAPSLLAERLAATDEKCLRSPIILDEVQKVPQLLDEVHRLIETRGLSFILCGSSARKLKRGHANLLGGRAWRYEMLPLVSAEVKEMNLLRALNHGLIPVHYLQSDPDCAKSLKAYVRDYLKEEVFDEGLTRNLPAFSRFFDAAAYSHGELVNFTNVARDCGVDSKTVKEYYQILSDTLLGTLLEPFKKRQSRQVIGKAPKFYLFDVGVAGELVKRRLLDEKGEAFGRAFEHLVFMELAAYRSYSGKDFPLHFWRTKSGLEVDFVLGDGETAVEAKGTSRVDGAELKALHAFKEEYSPRKAFVVCNERAPRDVGSIHIVPWRDFFASLWGGNVI
jgi:predicted AAA+ superfamily ATPase